MRKMITFILFGLISFGASAQVNKACPALQRAEGIMVGLAFYDSELSQDRAFCYFLSRAVSSPEGIKVGLDGELMKSISYCVESKTVDFRSMAKEVNTALKSVKNCFSQMGQ